MFLLGICLVSCDVSFFFFFIFYPFFFVVAVFEMDKKVARFYAGDPLIHTINDVVALPNPIRDEQMIQSLKAQQPTVKNYRR